MFNVLTVFTFLGQKILVFFEEFGNVTLLMGQTLSGLFSGKRVLKRTLDQMLRLGVHSLPITLVTASFVGMAFTLQVVKEFLKFGAAELIGGVVGLAVWRELGPLLTAVVVAGRVGAAISAELGTMKVTEQVEALESLSQEPAEFLVLPRLLACTLMLPLLVGLADIVGYLSGFLVAVGHNVNPYSYFGSADSMLKVGDITGGLIKALLFGFAIGLISSYMGLRATGGAKGVGEMTTKAVVVSLITVFVLNYILSLSLY